MRWRGFILIALAALGASVSAKADDRLFSVNGTMGYSSLYMSDGFRIGGDHPVVQPSVELVSPLKGLSASFWTSLQLDRQNQQYDEYDLMLLYRRDFLQDKRYGFNLHGYLDYWTFPKLDTSFTDDVGNTSPEHMNGNKVHAGVSMNRLLPLLGSFVVPTYNVYYWLYWAQNQSDQYQGGAHHEFVLSYYRDIPHFIPGTIEEYWGLSGTMNYNDGAFNVQPGWSHATASLSAGIAGASWLGYIAVNRQWSFISSVDSTNEIWTNVSFTKYF